MTDIPRRPPRAENTEHPPGPPKMEGVMDDLMKKLKEAPKDKVDQILTEDVQKFMKDNPYLPGKLKAHIKELTDACKKEGILKDVELQVDGRSGKAVVDDKATHKKFQINADNVVDKGSDKSAKKHEEPHSGDKKSTSDTKAAKGVADESHSMMKAVHEMLHKYPINESQPNRNAVDKDSAQPVPEKPTTESRKKDTRVPEPYLNPGKKGYLDIAEGEE